MHFSGDNTGLVATDTIKNTVYVVAQQTSFDSLELYGLHLTKHFLDTYPMLTKVEADLKEHPWTRAIVGREPHTHGFERTRGDWHVAAVTRTRDDVSITAGLRNLVVLKTTQSGFSKFLHDKYTTLPDIEDRLLSTAVSADWRYLSTDPTLDFNGFVELVRTTLLETFFGFAHLLECGITSSSRFWFELPPPPAPPSYLMITVFLSW